MTLGSGSWCSGEIGIRGRFAHKILVICCTMVVIVSTKNCERGDMSSYISISFLIHMGLSANTVLPIPMDYEWLIISILMKKTCFSIFSLRRDRFSPGATVMIVSMRLGSARGPPGNAGSPLNPARFASVFPSKNWDHLRQRAKSPHLGA